MRNGNGLLLEAESLFAYMVGSTELKRERVYHFLDLELPPASGPKNVKWEEMNCYSALPFLLRS